MAEIQTFARPAWQTDELEDEWIEPDEDEEEQHQDNRDATFSSLSQGTRSLSMTTPISNTLHVVNGNNDSDTSDDPTTSSQAGGTFLVRQDVPAAPLLPQTPGRNMKKGLIKDFFSPLPLEMMFEPPSPPPSSIPLPVPKSIPNQPAVSSRLVREYVPSVTDDSERQDDDQPHGTDVANVPHRPFTFSVPRQTSQSPSSGGEGFPQAQSTPLPPGAPMTDPRLKLFQFQYDTFTRDHLSAIVDSIAVNTPSGGQSSPASGASSYVSESVLQPGNISHLRSAKRMRLSPRSDYGEGDGEGASIARPKLYGKDYVGESRKMMEQIKSARDFSTISTTTSAQEQQDGDVKQGRSEVVEARPALLTVPSVGHTVSSPNSLASSTSSTSRLEKYSSMAYRKQAADLMAQIKSDMKGAKRIFSTDTEATETSRKGDGKENDGTGAKDKKGHHRGASSTSTVFTKASKTHTQARTSPGRSPGRVGSSPGRVGRSPKTRSSPRRLRGSRVLEEDILDGMRDMSIEEQGTAVPIITTANASVQGTIRISRPPAASTAPTQPGLLAPSAFAAGSLRVGTDDLNRFVSSSTATSGTTLTAHSAQSFVKHAGPGGAVNMRRIGPEEVQGMLGERVGKMVFDKVMMKWVKGVAGKLPSAPSGDAATGMYEEEKTEHTRASMESEDPFRDIESLREDGDVTSAPGQSLEDIMSRITETEREDAEADDEEEMELNSFSFDGPSAGVVNVMTGVDTGDDLTTDSEDDDDRLVTETDHEHEQDIGDGFDSDEELPEALRLQLIAPSWGTPRASPARQAMSPRSPKSPRSPRAVMKSRSNTPVSALKGGTGPRNHRTPANRMGHRRSVSFSDGKREGPIRGVGRATEGDERSMGFVPSARSKRIADMMEDLESPEFVGEDSPTKSSASGRRSSDEMRPMRKPNTSSSKHDASRRVFSRSQTQRQSASGNTSHVKAAANATFLTECSFGVSHDRLVQIITDVEPFEPYWENISSIDLSKKNVESVARLKEFLPKLDALSLNSNQLSWLSGVPGGVRTLSVSSNCLTGITSFSHLLNLENLDISYNEIESLAQLDCLRHLRELRADGNKITSVDGLQKMDGLVKLSLQDNRIQDVDLSIYRWTRLEMLNLSGNRVNGIDGLASLPSLIALNIDNNTLGDLEPGGAMARLRILRVSGNRLRRLNVASFPNLRTLYADNNALTGLVKAERLTKLENLSLRNQTARGFNLSTREIRDVKRLYLSGNALQGTFISEPCYNLVYLELAGCRLTALPATLASLAPNLRVLNLNYNFIDDARPLGGLTRLKKLTLIGSRLGGTKPLVRVLEGMGDVEMLDFRMNPCTLGWYLPLLVKDVPGALQPSEDGGGRRRDKGQGSNGDSSGNGDGRGSNGGKERENPGRGGKGKDLATGVWRDLDAKFRRDLPDEAYVGRLAYRGLVMRACPRIRVLDGVDVTEKERAKATHLLQGIASRRKGAPAAAKS